jgi:hypothetical protein
MYNELLRQYREHLVARDEFLSLPLRVTVKLPKFPHPASLFGRPSSPVVTTEESEDSDAIVPGIVVFSA